MMLRHVAANTRISQSLYYFLGTMTLLILGFRFRYGVDLSDEPLYLAMAYRFVLGDRPYVDEYQLVQGASLFNYFFVKLFLAIHKSTEGIVIAARYAYFFLTLIVAAVVFRTFRRLTSGPIAFLSAFVFASIIPFGLPAPGYNTLGISFLTLGLTSGIQFWVFRRSAVFLTLAGFFFGLACVAHPAHFVTTGAYGLFLLLFSKTERFKNAVVFSAGWVVAVSSLVLYFGITWSDFFFCYKLTSQMNGDFGNHISFTKALSVLKDLVKMAPWSVPLSVGLILALTRGKGSLRASVIAVLVLPVIYLQYRTHGALHSIVVGLGILAPFIAYFLKEDSMNALIRWVWAPCAVSAFFMPIASYNGANVAAVALWPACMISALMISRYFEKNSSNWSLAHFLTPLPALQALVMFTYLQFHMFYMDDSLPKLTVKIPSGPYAGLYTGEPKSKFLRTVEREILLVEQSSKRLVIYPHFPGGYLFSKYPPATLSVWGCLVSDRVQCTDYFFRKADPYIAAIRINELCRFEGTCYSGGMDHDFDKMVENKFHEKKELGPFTVFTRPVF